MKLYVDTNVLLQALEASPVTGGMVAETFYLQSQGASLVSSVLTAVEIDRVLLRHGGDHSHVAPSLLRGFDLLSLTPSVIDLARIIPVPYLKTLDALHLATAVISKCDAVATLDNQFARACTDVGMPLA